MSQRKSPGVALKSKENRGQVQVQVPMDNLARTRRYLGLKILELIQDFYTEERVIHITREDEPGNPQEEMIINEVTPEGAILNDVTKGKYDIVVTTVPARDAWHDSQFAELLNMRQAGVQIPAYRVVQYSHLAEKDAIAEEVRNLEGLGQKTPEEQQMMNMQMQIAMQQMQLELQKMSAEIQNISAQAQLNQAKAVDVANSDEMEMRQIEADMQKEREGFAVRQQLADTQSAASMQGKVLDTKGKILQEQAKASLQPKEKENP